LQDDEEAIRHIDEFKVFTSELTFRAMRLAFATTYWPIRPLNIEAVERMMGNEVEYLLLFTDTPMPEELKKYLE
jgi:hypothetical protein